MKQKQEEKKKHLQAQVAKRKKKFQTSYTTE